MKSKKIFAVVMAAAMAASVLAGCGSKTGGDKAAGNGPDKDQYLNVVLLAEPKTLDASKATDLYSSTILNEVNEGLTRIEQDANGKDVVKPAGAESWEVKDNGQTWIFHLRDYSWTDGQKVTAQQFEYGIKRTLDPKVGSAYAFLLYPIKGAVEYNTKKGTADQVGVKALDEKTLQFTLSAPTPYFLDLTYFKVMNAQRQDVIEKNGDKYGTEAETMIFNGPFVIKDWVHGSQVTLAKNDKYWDAKTVKLNTINYRIIRDENTRMQELFAGNLDTGTVTKPEWIQKFSDTSKWTNIKGFDPSTSYEFFNEKVKLFSNAKVRRAFQMAIDREDIVKTLYKGVAAPAYGWVPPSLQIGGEDFRQKANYEPLKDVKSKVTDPKALLVEGLKELNDPTLGTDPSKITVTYLESGTDATSKEFAEYFQQAYQKALGITLKVEYMEWAVFQKRTDEGDYEMGGMAWSGDYNDPMTEFDMWVSDAGIVPTGYNNPAYDALIKKAAASNDQAERLNIFKQAEKTLLADDAVISPTVYRQRNTFRSNYVKNVMSPLFGSGSELKYAYTQGRPQ